MFHKNSACTQPNKVITCLSLDNHMIAGVLCFSKQLMNRNTFFCLNEDCIIFPNTSPMQCDVLKWNNEYGLATGISADDHDLTTNAHNSQG